MNLASTLYVCLHLFTACVSCCFVSSLLILTVKLLVVMRKILCYAGRGQAPSPDSTHRKTAAYVNTLQSTYSWAAFRRENSTI